jgi:putative sterol carrier protein
MQQLAEQLSSDPTRTQGLRDAYQFIISGEAGGEWWIQAEDGAGSVHRGRAPSAAVTVRMDDDVFVKLGTSELDGGSAFAEGLLTVEGDQGKVMHLPQIFGD